MLNVLMYNYITDGVTRKTCEKKHQNSAPTTALEVFLYYRELKHSDGMKCVHIRWLCFEQTFLSVTLYTPTYLPFINNIDTMNAWFNTL